MLTGNPLLVLIVVGLLAFLAVIQFWLATRHDHAVSIQGPLEEERAIFARVAEKRATLADIEHDLQKRREALAVVMDIQAEVDALGRKRDDLLDEWNQMDERRSEVLALRRELEESQIEKLRFDAELAAAKAEHEDIRERVTRAERLLDQVEDMQEQHAELTSKIEKLLPEMRRLEGAQERVDRLDARAHDLEKDASRLEGILAARQSGVAEAEEILRSGRSAVAGVREELTRVEAELAASAVEKRGIQADVARLQEARASLEARNAMLERKISRASGGDAATDDPLRELKVVPQVVSVLRDWKESAIIDENDALRRVQLHFQATGLTYPERTLRAFHTSMKVNESTQMAVLAGISGTGKSQLPRQYAAGMGIGFLQVPVQPRWDSPQDLMGFYNYVEGRFRPTDMARALWAMDELNNAEGALKDRMLMILLDEMNLARVEYYFSDFLSRLESRPAAVDVTERALRKDAEIELEIPTPDGQIPRIFPGYNLLFAGTMNEDESTQSLSDKVVDRANVIRFAAPKQIVRGSPAGQRPATEALKRSRWAGWSLPRRDQQEREVAQAKIAEMVDLMKVLGRPFGHRLGRAMLAYVDRYPVTEGVANIVNRALADQVEMRLLPKLRGIEVEAKSQEIDRLRKFVSDLGDDQLSDAIRQSVETAETTGQFVWQGVTR
ncbi:chromosome segregation ATPase-like protein [Tabrizicola sp. WMC-M-20]|nr:chromosome segregation ATPase-like protein [Tabrizicola sp. WMC-M-20]